METKLNDEKNRKGSQSLEREIEKRIKDQGISPSSMCDLRINVPRDFP